MELEQRINGKANFVIANMVPDWVFPFEKDGLKIPQVVQSSHPRYFKGKRMDYGFLMGALREGYSVLLTSHNSCRAIVAEIIEDGKSFYQNLRQYKMRVIESDNAGIAVGSTMEIGDITQSLGKGYSILFMQ